MSEYLKKDINTLLEINHIAYIKQSEEKCINLNIEFNEFMYDSFSSKYLYQLIKHPNNDEYALIIDNNLYLDDIYKFQTTTEEQMELDGWFDYPELS